MTVSKPRATRLLALVIPGLLLALGAGSVLCIGSDGHISLEYIGQNCCPGTWDDSQKVFDAAAESWNAPDASGCDSCLDVLLIESTPALARTLKAQLILALQAPPFAGAAPLPTVSDAALPSLPGHDRALRSAPSHLFASTISLRC